MISRVDSKHCSELVFEVILRWSATTLKRQQERSYTTRRVQEHSVHLKPCSPKDTRDPHAVTINHTANVVARLELDLVLDIEVDNTHDTVWCKQVGERIDDRVELGNHGKTVAHS